MGMKKLIVVLVVILSLIPNLLISQPWGPGGPNGGGPPPPPDNYCQQFPDDPACGGNTAVPVSSTEGMIIFVFLSGIFFYYKMKGNSFKHKQQ